MSRAVPDHGDRRRYQRGCKCVACRNANAEYQRRYRERWTPIEHVHTTPGGYRYRQLALDVDDDA